MQELPAEFSKCVALDDLPQEIDDFADKELAGEDEFCRFCDSLEERYKKERDKRRTVNGHLHSVIQNRDVLSRVQPTFLQDLSSEEIRDRIYEHVVEASLMEHAAEKGSEAEADGVEAILGLSPQSLRSLARYYRSKQFPDHPDTAEGMVFMSKERRGPPITPARLNALLSSLREAHRIEASLRIETNEALCQLAIYVFTALSRHSLRKGWRLTFEQLDHLTITVISHYTGLNQLDLDERKKEPRQSTPKDDDDVTADAGSASSSKVSKEKPAGKHGKPTKRRH